MPLLLTRRRALVALAGSLIGGAAGIGEPHITMAQAETARGSALNLDNDASQWGVYIDPPTKKATWSLDNVSTPSLDSTALRAALLGGDPYTAIHVYRNLAPVCSGTNFEMELHFCFTPLTAIQGLEFTMNKWNGGKRWEWALQWQRIGDGGPEQGSPPNWRLWTGSLWKDTGIGQELAADEWHHLRLVGGIKGGKVRYSEFTCDGRTGGLGHTFAPVTSAAPDRLAVAIQLDANYAPDPYEVVADGVNLRWY